MRCLSSPAHRRIELLKILTSSHKFGTVRNHRGKCLSENGESGKSDPIIDIFGPVSCPSLFYPNTFIS